MTKKEINTALEELLKLEFSKESIEQGRTILEAYQSAVAHHQHELKEAFVAEGGLPEDFKLERDEEDIHFDELWADFSKHKKDFRAKLANEEKENLTLKEQILEKIHQLKEEEHIKNAQTAFKELEEKWKGIGRIPSEKVKELDAAYSKARDEFFYNMHIYRELLENDLKRNLQLKEEIIEKMKALSDSKSIKDLESAAKRLTNEWNEIGPTYKEKWEEVRDKFWAAHHEIFDKIKSFYKSQKEIQKENLERKLELIKQLKEINNYNSNSDKSWRKHTNMVLELQKAWKNIGFAPKGENEKVWDEFKSEADHFFSKKSEFYKQLKDEFDANKLQKEKLVAQAEELIHHPDHKFAASSLTKLQKQWRQIGAAHHRDEQRLWKKFRAACNSFFDHKKEQDKNETKEQHDNLVKKRELIQQIATLEIGESADENLQKLDALIKEFNHVGFVPLSEKTHISSDFKKAVQKKLSTMGIPENEMTEYLFLIKIKELAGTQNPEQALEIEAQFLREKIRAIKSSLLQYENNLGFFANSKGADALKKEVEKKIESNKQILQNLEDKLQMVYSHLN
jgi:predicted DNA-binding protein YlxM (UPF0122 family)